MSVLVVSDQLCQTQLLCYRKQRVEISDCKRNSDVCLISHVLHMLKIVIELHVSF